MTRKEEQKLLDLYRIVQSEVDKDSGMHPLQEQCTYLDGVNDCIRLLIDKEDVRSITNNS